MTDDILQSVQAIHAAPPRLVYVFAGAGALALHWLHAVAGSSRTVLEARDCYAPRSLAEVVGDGRPQAVSRAVAAEMASWAFRRAALLALDDAPRLGVGCTAAIATDRARRGLDRAFVAVSHGLAPRVYELGLSKAGRSRAEQELLVSRLVIRAVALACGAPAPALALLADERLGEP